MITAQQVIWLNLYSYASVIAHDGEGAQEPSITKRGTLDVLTGGAIIIGTLVSIVMAASNGNALITNLSGADTDAHVFATANDLYNIFYWTFRVLLALLFIVVLIMINCSTFKFNGSIGMRLFTAFFASANLVGPVLMMGRVIKMDARGKSTVNYPEYYMTT